MAGFKDVVGHERLVDYFRRAIRNGNISHAYLLTGEDGIGKMTLARAFAMALQCKEGTDGDSCGVCRSCKQFVTDNHPDVVYVKHEKPASIGVDEIRDQLVTDAEIRPYQGPYKIYIIDDAEKMTAQAQNALLKTLEEPPAYVVILLLATHENSMLQTILSRCLTLPLRPLPDDRIRSWLMEQQNLDRGAAQMCVAWARGNLGKALRMAQAEEFRGMYQEVLSLLSQMHRQDTFTCFQVLKGQKEEFSGVLSMMRLWYRDVEVYKASEKTELLIFRDFESAIDSQSRYYSFASLDRIQKEIEHTEERLQANVSFETALEILLIVLKQH